MKNTILNKLKELTVQSKHIRRKKRDKYKVLKTEPSSEPVSKLKAFHFSKKRFSVTIIIAALAVTVPIVFATASKTNEVAKIMEITPRSDVNSVATENNNVNDVLDETIPAAAEGELTSDLTESITSAEPTAPALPPDPTPTPSPSPTEAPVTETVYTVITPGMEDPFVPIIQQRLMDLDYMERDEPTTLFGPVTSQAIEYFQRKHDLPIDGIAGPETQELLFSENAKYYTVSEGASGPDVESIQERLDDLGYSVGDTGYFGSDTTKAVAYFQRMNGLTDDGNVGSQTREALYSRDAVYSLEYEKKSSSSKPPSDNNSDNGSGSDGNENVPAAAANPGNVEAFVNAALAQVGKPYVLGGKGPDIFDCSGFVYYALKISGNGIGYMTSGGWANSGYTRINSMNDLQRGDVVCFDGHVGIYLGDGTMVDASPSAGGVRISSNIFNTAYWVNNFICGRRPL